MNNNVPKLRFKEFIDEWKEQKIGQTLKIKHGKDQKKVIVENGKYPILGTGGEIGRTNEYLYDKESVLIGRKGTIDKPRFMNTPFWTVDTLFYSEIKTGFLGKFLYYEFQKINWKKYCEASGVPSLSASTIESIKYKIPSLQEQEKIAEFFTILDNLIEEQDGKVSDLELYKKGMMQKIFSQEIRFKDENGCDYPEWEEDKLNKYLFESKEKNKLGEFTKRDVLSVSGEYGVINQIEHLGRSYAGVSVLPYGVVRTNDIVYTKSPLKSNPYGIIKANRGPDGIVSTLYAIYSCKKNILSDFVHYYFELDDNTNRYVRPLVHKGAKNDMKINNEYFLTGLFKAPIIEEQQKIIKFFIGLDNLIKEEKENLDDLRKMKKGLLQQMFV